MSTPIETASEQGIKLFTLRKDVYAEVSLYAGKVFVGVRRWFLADDGNWYRTKNGLHLRYDDMIEVLAQAGGLIKFVQEQQQILGGAENEKPF